MRVSEPQIRKDSRLFEELCAALLRRGNAVQFRVTGQSMSPNLRSGDDVVVAPASASELRAGDVVLAKNADGLFVHRVDSFDPASGDIQLRSDTGQEFDAPASRIFGKVAVRRPGAHEQNFTVFQTRFVHPCRIAVRRARAAAKLHLRRLALLLSAVITLSLLGSTFLVPVVRAQTADLQLTQTPSSSSVAAGANYSYTEAVTNNVSSAIVASGSITVYMQTPPNTTYQSYSSTQTVPGTND